MIRCLRFKKLLMPYAEGVLDRKLTEKVGDHVAACPACARELEALRSVSGTLRTTDFPAMEPAADLWTRVQAEITEPVRRSRPWWQIQGYHAASAAGVAVVMLLAVLAVHSPVPQDKAAGPVPSMIAREPLVTEELPVRDVEKLAKAPQTEAPVARINQDPSSSSARLRESRPQAGVKLPGTRAPGRTEAVPKAGPGGNIESVTGPTAKVRPVQPTVPLLSTDALSYEGSVQRPASDAPSPHAPWFQAGRIPGGSQQQIPTPASPAPGAPTEEKLERRTSDYADDKKPAVVSNETAKAARVDQFGTAAAESPTSSAEKDDDAILRQKDDRLAAAPGSATGSMVNTAPPAPGESLALTRDDARNKTSAGVPVGMSFHSRSALDANIRRNERILKEKPNDIGAMRSLSLAYRARGYTEKHIDIRERIAKERPDDAYNWLELGKAYQQCGQIDKARSAFKKASAKGNDAVKKEAKELLQKLDSKKK